MAPPGSELPRGYAKTLGEIKQRIREERLRVVLAANSAMVLLYWDIGRMILDRQERAGWGAKVIDRLAADLRESFLDMQGFSPRNLKYMRAFGAAWPERAIVQELLARITWYHNIMLIEKLGAAADRLWYARQVMEHGWSRNILALQIDARAHARHGKAISNFKATLPPADSDMAAQVFKDPYLFDFLGTADPRRERDVEQALVDHIHGKLRCYVVIELKAVPFEPGFAGQMNMYLPAVDDLPRHPDDKPTIGFLLCRAKDGFVVEYAVRDLRKPIGVAGWETTLVGKLPRDLKGSLPTVEEIEAELDARGRP